MNVLALCSGVGGLELGLSMATGGRARAVCYVERDAYAASVLLARMEDKALERAPVWDDITTFDARPWSGVVDLVAAGFPCQPWSMAGKRKGVDDARWIWPDIARIVSECEPGLVFLENVPGLYRHGLREVLSDLASLGFNAEWTCVAASDLGAPHKRERVFILAYRQGWSTRRARSWETAPDDSEPLAHRDGADSAEPQLAGVDVADPDERRPARLGRSGEEGAAERSEGLEHSERARWSEAGRSPLNAGPEPSQGVVCLEHSERPRLEGPGHPGPQWQPFPPAPGDTDGWRAWLAAGGPAPAQSRLRGSVDGSAARLDRLRCLGNAVVPQQAALAFRILAERVGL